MTLEVLIYGVVAVVALWQLIVYGSRLLSWIERSEIARQQAEAVEGRKRRAAAAPPVARGDANAIPDEHVAAIAAAVATFGYQVVHIADGASGSAWVSEGRWMHQTSHRPH